jgi:hypothetical protein
MEDKLSSGESKLSCYGSDVEDKGIDMEDLNYWLFCNQSAGRMGGARWAKRATQKEAIH